MKYFLILTIPVLLFLSGCAKMMNENQCLAADWRSIGYQDGTEGRSESLLGERGKACAEYGVTPNMDQYLMGRTQGLQNYCQPRRAFDIGLRGERYENVCPPELEGPFLTALQDGQGLGRREQILTDIDHSIAEAYQGLGELENNIAEQTAIMLGDGVSTEERAGHAIDIKKMAEERGRIQASIPIMEADLERARIDLDAYRNSIA